MILHACVLTSGLPTLFTSLILDFYPRLLLMSQCTALRKSRLFLNRHLEVIESARKVREELQEELQDALQEGLRVERQRSEEKLKEMEDDKKEMQRMRDLERKAERENEERWVYESEGLKK